MDRSSFLRLISPEGQTLLAEVGELDSKTDVLALVSKLRKHGHSSELVADVLSQAKLRRRAQAKFGDFASTMFFTEAGLEQASRLKVAAIHAGRFRSAGVTDVADLGCGIGAESLAMASLDINVSAFELDEVTAAMATYNLASFNNVKVEQADVTKIDLTKFGGFFIDPARRELDGPARESSKRKFDLTDLTPSFDFVLEIAKTKPTIAKLGPGIDHKDIPAEAEAVWVSDNGDLVEASLYFNQVRRAEVARAALLLTPDGSHEITSPNRARTDAPIDDLAEYIFEPDNSVIRSHLVAELAEANELHLFAPEIAYLTGAKELISPWLKSYRVLDNLSFDRKRLKAYLRERGIGTLEIKKRGADITPEQLRRELDPKGPNSATLIVTRVGTTHRVLVVEGIR
jgi:SAM-dependent methyltransferase